MPSPAAPSSRIWRRRPFLLLLCATILPATVVESQRFELGGPNEGAALQCSESQPLARYWELPNENLPENILRISVEASSLPARSKCGCARYCDAVHSEHIQRGGIQGNGGGCDIALWDQGREECFVLRILAAEGGFPSFTIFKHAPNLRLNGDIPFYDAALTMWRMKIPFDACVQRCLQEDLCQWVNYLPMPANNPEAGRWGCYVKNARNDERFSILYRMEGLEGQPGGGGGGGGGDVAGNKPTAIPGTDGTSSPGNGNSGVATNGTGAPGSSSSSSPSPPSSATPGGNEDVNFVNGSAIGTGRSVPRGSTANGGTGGDPSPRNKTDGTLLESTSAPNDGSMVTMAAGVFLGCVVLFAVVFALGLRYRRLQIQKLKDEQQLQQHDQKPKPGDITDTENPPVDPATTEQADPPDVNGGWVVSVQDCTLNATIHRADTTQTQTPTAPATTDPSIIAAPISDSESSSDIAGSGNSEDISRRTSLLSSFANTPLFTSPGATLDRTHTTGSSATALNPSSPLLSQDADSRVLVAASNPQSSILQKYLPSTLSEFEGNSGVGVNVESVAETAVGDGTGTVAPSEIASSTSTPSIISGANRRSLHEPATSSCVVLDEETAVEPVAD
ncbi:hypothetical protein HK102_004767 [Quaeritorhiza haematococci]|nr:hypothetical protein HK102_004767 [Quaeritorhiza haematococci]